MGKTWWDQLDELLDLDEDDDIFFPVLRGLFRCTQQQIKSFTLDPLKERITAFRKIPEATLFANIDDKSAKQLGALLIDTVLQFPVAEINKRVILLKQNPRFFTTRKFPDDHIGSRFEVFTNLPTLIESQEKGLALLKTLNFGFTMNEKAPLSKEWNLANSSQNKDTKPATLKKKAIGVEILGKNYTFSHDLPALKDLDKTPFVFSVERRGTKPGTYIQYWNDVQSVSSNPYNGNGKGEWETLVLNSPLMLEKRVSIDCMLLSREQQKTQILLQ